MPNRCCVPFCPSNPKLNNKGQVTVFSFPKSDARKQLWLKHIPRENYVPGNYSGVCINHFKEQFVIRVVSATKEDGTLLVVGLKKPRLSEDAYPSIFEDVSYQPPKTKSSRIQKRRSITTREKKECKSSADPIKTEHTVKDEQPLQLTELDDAQATPMQQLYSNEGSAENKEDGSKYSDPTISCPWCNISFQDQSALEDHSELCQMTSELIIINKSEEDVSPSETIEQNPTSTSEICIEKIGSDGLQAFKTVVYKGHRLLSCEECSALFFTHFDLENHKIQHSDIASVTSQTATAVNSKPLPQTQNNSEAKTNRLFCCLLCQETFDTNFELRIHKRSHKETKRLFLCDVCGKCFQCSSNLTAHKRIHANERPHSCDTCEKKFTRRAYLKRHKRSHTGERPYSCSVCTATYRDKSSLYFHIQSHKGTKGPYLCNVCGKHFQRSSKLAVHKRIHTNERPYSCDICQKKFTERGSLNYHKKVHTGDRSFGCDVCGAVFIQQATLKIHQRIHTGDRPFGCDVCGAAFILQATLKVHQRIHTGERPYSCTVCTRSFRQKAALIVHKRSHTGERPFPCDLCNLACNSHGDLKAHRRCHTGERPYSCDICDAAFAHSTTLKVHKQRHLGEKRFLCDACGTTFFTVSELNTHKRKHTGEQPFRCDVCDVRFTQSASLYTHKKRHSEKNS